MRFVGEVKPSDIVAALSLLVAILSTTAALLRESRTKRREAFAIRQQYFAHIEAWARRVIEVMSKAARATELDPSKMNGKFFELRHDILTTLSALIDEGRWYFPNIRADNFGQDKELAFQGYRQRVLDCIVETLRLTEAFDYANASHNTTKREPLVSLKREFASEIQRIISPWDRRREFAYLTGDRTKQVPTN